MHNGAFSQVCCTREATCLGSRCLLAELHGVPQYLHVLNTMGVAAITAVLKDPLDYWPTIMP